MTFKPMLASPLDLSKTTWPLYASPKLDGIRATVVDGKLLSRSLKPIQNKFINAQLSSPLLHGLDGELIVGPVTAPDVFAQSTSGVMRREGNPDFTFFVFDWVTLGGAVWTDRLNLLIQLFGNSIKHDRVQLLSQQLIASEADLDAYEAKCIDQGYEGVITRHPGAPYKFGRSTPREGYLSKVKRFEDSEALVIDVIEEQFNGNVAETNELGRTKRSSAAAGKTGKGTMGALAVRDLATGVEFCIGTGFTALQRGDWWNDRHFHTCKTIVKYKFFPVGVKDAPRHPVFLGIRAAEDMP